MEFMYFLDAWELFKVWPASGGFVEDKGCINYLACAHKEFFLLLTPHLLDTIMK